MQGHTLEEQSLLLQCGECIVRLQSNSVQLLEVLQHYFRYLLIEHTPSEADINVIAIESAVMETPYVFQDWPREAGKSGRKDAYYDLDDARLVRKVRTGMLFLQSETCTIAVGPCLTYPNQVINFINSQHMNWLQQRHWLICHAAAVVYKNQAYAMAGLSGGGKSTLMLHLMNDDEINFLSNDRLFIRRNEKTVDVVGIAKLPRINPGTIVNNPRLQSLIPEQERKQLLSLPKQQLWDREDKYDVDIESVYGCGRISDNKPLQAFIVLNWQHGCEQAFQVNKVNLRNRRDLLGAIMKSSGPFYQDNNGAFLAGNTGFDEERYLSILSGIVIYEVYGKIDFQALHDYFYHHIISEGLPN